MAQTKQAPLLFLVLLLASLGAYGSTQPSSELTEPLPVHNLYAPVTRFYDPLPASALKPYLQTMGIDLLQSYTSDFEIRGRSGDGLVVDMELYTLELALSHALTQSTEAGLVIPLHYAYRGVLDSFLRDYHDALGLPNSDRDRRPDDDFAYYFVADGAIAWHGTDGLELGNIALRLRQSLWNRPGQAIALLAAIQLATASASRGWSSGEPDLALGAVYSHAGRRWFGHLEGNYIYPLSEDEGGFHYRSYLRGNASLGYLLSRRWSLLIQLQGGTSPYRSGLPELDKGFWMLSFGARFAPSKKWNLSLTLLEGLTQETSPDFTFNFGLHIDW